MLKSDGWLELEGLLLRIFRHDLRIELSNKQFGGKVFKKLSGKDAWECSSWSDCPWKRAIQ